MINILLICDYKKNPLWQIKRIDLFLAQMLAPECIDVFPPHRRINLKGGDPSAPSSTDTLLRLNPHRWIYLDPLKSGLWVPPTLLI